MGCRGYRSWLCYSRTKYSFSSIQILWSFLNHSYYPSYFFPCWLLLALCWNGVDGMDLLLLGYLGLWQSSSSGALSLVWLWQSWVKTLSRWHLQNDYFLFPKMEVLSWFPYLFPCYETLGILGVSSFHYLPAPWSFSEWQNYSLRYCQGGYD